MTEDEENAWRALKDQDGIVPRRCNWGFHRYTVWKVEAVADYGSGSKKEIRLIRQCADCHIPRYKIIKKPLI